MNNCPFYKYGEPCGKENCKECVIGGVTPSGILKLSDFDKTDYCCTICHRYLVSTEYLDYDIDENVCKSCDYKGG